MRLPTLLRLSGTAAAACTALTVVVGCGGADTATETDPDIYGTAVPIGDGSGRAYVLQDADGNPTAVGLRLTADALDGLSDSLESSTSSSPPPTAPPTPRSTTSPSTGIHTGTSPRCSSTNRTSTCISTWPTPRR